MEGSKKVICDINFFRALKHVCSTRVSARWSTSGLPRRTARTPRLAALRRPSRRLPAAAWLQRAAHGRRRCRPRAGPDDGPAAGHARCPRPADGVASPKTRWVKQNSSRIHKSASLFFSLLFHWMSICLVDPANLLPFQRYLRVFLAATLQSRPFVDIRVYGFKLGAAGASNASYFILLWTCTLYCTLDSIMYRFIIKCTGYCSVADPWHFGVDPDPDPRILASD